MGRSNVLRGSMKFLAYTKCSYLEYFARSYSALNLTRMDIFYARKPGVNPRLLAGLPNRSVHVELVYGRRGAEAPRLS